MNTNIRLWGVWSGCAFLVVFFIGFAVIARWVPPLSPSMTAVEVSAYFKDRSIAILIGAVFITIGAVFYLSFTMILSDIVKEIEGRSYFLSGTQLVAGLVVGLTFFFPAFLWVTAAFRPERDPETTQALVDLGWLLAMTSIGPFILQYAALAAAIFHDKRERPVYPRWVGFLQVWVSLSYIPAPIAFFIKTGPFAWNGLFVFWIPLMTFGVWFIAMIHYSRQYILSSARAAVPQHKAELTT